MADVLSAEALLDQTEASTEAARSAASALAPEAGRSTFGAEIDLRGRLRDAEEELQAARTLNRAVIRERNSSVADTHP